MKINIVCIGKIKEKYFADAVDEYVKRCGRYADVKVIEVPDAPQSKSAQEQQKIESDALLSKAKGFLIAMDMRGEQFKSEAFAKIIETKCADGISEFSFLIGGSHGHSEQLKQRADMLLSFGVATFPHQLFRVMLAEQIYRTLSIIAGTPYHK